jgi:DNA-binding CsgD family transcriptional regulator/PAS domain-containing protein
MQLERITVAQKAKSTDVPLETFSKVVEAIYDCALDPSRWPNAIGLVSELLQSPRLALAVHNHANHRNEIAFQLGIENDDYWRRHEETYSRINPLFVPMLLQPVGAVATRSMVIGDDELFESRFYQEWAKPQGLHDVIGVKVLHTEQRQGFLTADRFEWQPRYGEREVRLLTLLSPHVCRAVTISDVLDLKTIRSEALESALNALSSAVYLTDRHARVVFMNRVAERQVKTSNVLRIDNNRLTAVNSEARTALARAINEICVVDEAEMSGSGFTLALPEQEQAGFVATILPLSRGERRNICGAFAATAAIFVQDPVVVPPFPGEAFAKLYGLTGSELRVLLAMAPGLTVKEAAEMLGIGETTTKTHLQHIYGKTGTSKQTELMHLFMSSTPPVKAAQA